MPSLALLNAPSGTFPREPEESTAALPSWARVAQVWPGWLCQGQGSVGGRASSSKATGVGGGAKAGAWIATHNGHVQCVYCNGKRERARKAGVFTVIYIPPRGIRQRTRQSVRQKRGRKGSRHNPGAVSLNVSQERRCSFKDIPSV